MGKAGTPSAQIASHRGIYAVFERLLEVRSCSSKILKLISAYGCNLWLKDLETP
jgi:hypothetical protein